MAKRFTDTEKWKDDWYLSLSNDYKIVWQWLLDNCNHAGICKKNIRLLNFMCNTDITENQMIEIMDDRVLAIKNFWFIPKFLKFQYSSLGNNRPVINSVRIELDKNNLSAMVTELFGNDYLIIKEKEKEKDKDKRKDKGQIAKNQNFEENGEFKPSGNFKAQGEELFAYRYHKHLKAVQNGESNSQVKD